MKAQTTHRNNLKSALQKALQIEGADTVKLRYRTLRYSLLSEHPNLISGTDKEVMLCFLKDVIYLDRQLRLLTEDVEKEEKEVLSQNYQIEELGCVPGFEESIRLFNKL